MISEKDWLVGKTNWGWRKGGVLGSLEKLLSKTTTYSWDLNLFDDTKIEMEDNIKV